MRRWSIAWGGAVLAALWVLTSRSWAPSLLDDTDTSVLLRTIRAKGAPFSWFLSDWPLYNHFYRPIPTLAFEVDSRISGNNAAGYGWTNCLLAVACVFALFWFLRELLDKPLAAAAGTLLFASWQTSTFHPDWRWVWVLAGLTLVVGAIRHRNDWRAYVPASLVLLFLAHELDPIESLQARVIDWLPGRTASSMTLFALLAMAAYARFERLGRSEEPAEVGPLTPPATRSAVAGQASGVRWPWAIASLLAGMLCFASYEQAVMLPACIVGLAVYFRWQHRRPAWWLCGLFLALLGGYLLLRHLVIPPGISQYQHQQLRTTAGALNALIDFVWPFNTYREWNVLLDQGWLALLNSPIYVLALMWTVGVTTVYQLRKEWRLAFAGWALSVLAFLPMAWLKIFDHYYYWPLALRTVFVIAVASVAWRLVSTAWCPPALQAPKRPSPAPGSLPRP